MKNKTNISKLILGCRQNNRQAQKQFVQKYSGLIYAIAVRYMGDREKAQDIVQMSLLKVLKNIDTYDSERSKLETWMTRIVVNTCLSQLKKINLEVLSINSDISFDIPNDESIIDHLSNSELLDVIKELPDGFRQVFNLAVVEGYSHKEISEMIGIKEASSRSRLSRAKQLLREKLSNLKQYEPWVKMR